LYGYVGKTECCDRRPEFTAVVPACGYRILDPFQDLGEGCARKKRLHAEEVGVEQGREEGLVDEDLLDDERAFAVYGGKERTLVDRESILEL
jgi:hypothetical protein